MICRESGIQHSNLSSVLKNTAIGRDPYLSLGLLLTYELGKMQKSWWSGFLQTLPAMGHTPLFWSAEELQLVEQTPLYYDTLEVRQVLRHLWNKKVRKLAREYPKLFGSVNWDYETWKMAMALVWSRGVWIPSLGGPAIVPLVHLVRHREKKEEDSLFFSSGRAYDPNRRIFMVTASWDFEPGEMITMSYGRKDNETLLSDYSFIIPANEKRPDNDRITIDVSQAYCPYVNEEGYLDKLQEVVNRLGFTGLVLNRLVTASQKPRDYENKAGESILRKIEISRSEVPAPQPNMKVWCLNRSNPSPEHSRGRFAGLMTSRFRNLDKDQLDPPKKETSNWARIDGDALLDTFAASDTLDEGVRADSPLQPLAMDSDLVKSLAQRMRRHSVLKIDPKSCIQLLAFCRAIQLHADELDAILMLNQVHELLVPLPKVASPSDYIERQAVMEALRILELQPLFREFTTYNSKAIYHAKKSCYGSSTQKHAIVAQQFLEWYRSSLYTAISVLRDHLPRTLFYYA